jgi:serine/threonine protein phosphatase PrpC
VHDISPEDEFLVLASDGLWDVLLPQEAVKLIRYAVVRTARWCTAHVVFDEYLCSAAFEANKTPSEAAEELCERAIKLGSSDNVTVVITRFIHSATIANTGAGKF